MIKDYKKMLEQMGFEAKEAAIRLRTLSSADKNRLLQAIGKQLLAFESKILAANELDMKNAKQAGTSDAMLDRLKLDSKRIQDMIKGIEQTVALKDPVGSLDKMWLNDAGLNIGAKRVPLGVIGIIYESRPNVTVDAAALCLKTGNAVILKGGKEAVNTNIVLIEAIQEALKFRSLPVSCVQLIPSSDRELIKLFLGLKFLDCVIPRGGAGLIQFVLENAKVPVIETGTGNCHIFVDHQYPVDNARDIIINAKVQKPGACNAVETVLLHEKNLESHLIPIIESLRLENVKLAVCEKCYDHLSNLNKLGDDISLATESDWETEYLDYKLAIKAVSNIKEAIEHIEIFSTHHSEAILTENYANSEYFLNHVDSAAVYVNASTRFTDGNQFGFGAEIGISTQKLHARGPMGLEALTTIKYIIYGQGQIRD
ncbi:glutamate-5-semialdehyde dehydrogenase [Fusibacter ferrireducens]|nr:glutamate-5-semialdehyde dehydrogenase [Fusibacter ferrireducens]